MNILITGCSGFVGSYLTKALHKLGHTIIGIDINDLGPTCDSKSVDIFFKHDLTKPFYNYIGNIDLCIHLASSVGGILFNVDKPNIVVYNKIVNENVLNLCVRARCDRLLFFSSINVFEDRCQFSHEPLYKLTPYAESKVEGERLFESACENLMVIRPTNIFGKNQNRHGGFGESHVIPDLLKKIDESDILEVWGDGKQMRNFVHVVDLCNFILEGLNFNGKLYFNIRSDLTISITSLANSLMEFKGKALPIVYKKEYLQHERMKLVDFDMSLPIAFGWKQSIRSIGEGLLI
jgi:UDP-glucose 4-epimerase